MCSDGVVEPTKRDNSDDTWRVLSQNIGVKTSFQNMNHISTPWQLFGPESARCFHDITLEQMIGWKAAEKEI